MFRVLDHTQTVLANPFPAPGVSFVCKCFSSTPGCGMDEYKLTRPASETLLDHAQMLNFSH